MKNILLLTVAFVIVILISAAQAELVFSSSAAARIIIMKILATSPQGQVAVTAYQWAADPESSALSAINLPPGAGEVYSAVSSITADVDAGTLNTLKTFVVKQVFEDLPYDQQVAFLNAQEYSSYSQQVFTVNSNDAANQAEYSQDGILKLKTPEGKEFMQIPRGWNMTSKGAKTMTLTSSDADQEFMFNSKKTDISAYLKKGGTIKVQGQEIAEADFVTAKDSGIKLGDNQMLFVPADTSVKYKDGIIEVQGKTLQYGTKEIAIIDGPMKIEQYRLEGSFNVEDIRINGEVLTKEEGYRLQKGFAEQEKVRITVDDSNAPVLIAYPGIDTSKISSSWVKISKDKIDAQSVLDGKINMEVLEGNELFNTNKQDRLKINIFDGDSLNIVSRKTENIIPQIDYTSNGEGTANILNGRHQLSLEKGQRCYVVARPEKTDASPTRFEIVAKQIYDPTKKRMVLDGLGMGTFDISSGEARTKLNNALAIGSTVQKPKSLIQVLSQRN